MCMRNQDLMLTLHSPLVWPVAHICTQTSTLLVHVPQDCCGAGRGMEAVFDSVMFVWWTAGTVVLAVRADEANKAGLPKRDARNAVVAMAAISAFMFLALLVANIVLIKRLGKLLAFSGVT